MSHTNDLAFQGHKSLENTARLCFTVKTLLPLLCPSAFLLVLVGLFRFSLYQVPLSGRALCPGHGRTAGDSPRPKASGRARTSRGPPPTAAACGGIESHTPFSLFVLEIFTTNHEYQEGKRSSFFENPSSASEGQSAGPDPRWGERGCRRRSRPRTSSEPSRWRMRTRTRTSHQVRPVLGPRLPVSDLGLTRLRETRGCVYAVNGELSQAFIYLRYQVN